MIPGSAPYVPAQRRLRRGPGNKKTCNTNTINPRQQKGA